MKQDEGGLLKGFWLRGKCWREIAEGGKRIAEGKLLKKG
jgi:hypothetical protein